MTHIIGISGSLRSASFNHSLLQAAVQLAPESVTLDVRRINGIPLYDADVEVKSGIPASVVELKEAIAVADGVLLATPEYNNGIPGVFKNAIDWVSRPDSDIRRVFGGKAFALIGASPGGFGTILSQEAWLPVLRALGTRPWFGGRLLVSHANQQFDVDGNLTDESTRLRLEGFLSGFVEFIRSNEPSIR